MIEDVAPFGMVVENAAMLGNERHEIGGLVEVRELEGLDEVGDVGVAVVVDVPPLKIVISKDLGKLRVGHRLRSGFRQVRLGIGIDVGTPAGTDVYSPVAGSVVAVTKLVIGGKRVGSRIDLRPTRAPSVMVSVLNVKPDPAIAVGTPVLAATSKLGTAVNVAAVEQQALAAHAPDGGNNVSIAVYPSPGSLP